MRSPILLVILLLSSFLASSQDKKRISVIGQIKNKITKTPIPNAEVLVLCWYMCTFESACPKKQVLRTDENGYYKVTFAKGHRVDVASKAKGFIASRSFNKISDNHIQIDIELDTIKENPTLIKYLNTEHFTLYLTDTTPFLHIKFKSVDTSITLDLNSVETFGFDFHSLKTINDTSHCDIWFQPINREEQPDVIVASKNGGIIPVYSEDINSSFFYEKTSAPATGYLHEYKLKGNEEGFFVLSRDGKTYGKIIFEKSQSRLSGPDGNGGFFSAIGRYFSCLYQPNGTTDLSYSAPEIDLQNFLTDFRLF